MMQHLWWLTIHLCKKDQEEERNAENIYERLLFNDLSIESVVGLVSALIFQFFSVKMRICIIRLGENFMLNAEPLGALS
jgi:hypothetical protein